MCDAPLPTLPLRIWLKSVTSPIAPPPPRPPGASRRAKTVARMSSGSRNSVMSFSRCLPTWWSTLTWAPPAVRARNRSAVRGALCGESEKNRPEDNGLLIGLSAGRFGIAPVTSLPATYEPTTRLSTSRSVTDVTRWFAASAVSSSRLICRPLCPAVKMPCSDQKNRPSRIASSRRRARLKPRLRPRAAFLRCRSRHRCTAPSRSRRATARTPSVCSVVVVPGTRYPLENGVAGATEADVFLVRQRGFVTCPPAGSVRDREVAGAVAEVAGGLADHREELERAVRQGQLERPGRVLAQLDLAEQRVAAARVAVDGHRRPALVRADLALQQHRRADLRPALG